MAIKLQARHVWSPLQLLSLITETAKAMPEAGTKGKDSIDKPAVNHSPKPQEGRNAPSEL